MTNRFKTAALAAAISVCSVAAQADLPLATGNMLIMSQNTLTEYDADYLVQGTLEIPVVSSTEKARDITVLDDGRIAVFNGTFDPRLEIYDGASWRNLNIPGWSTVNNGTYGGIDSLGNIVFLTDTYTAGEGDAPRGLIAIDVDTGEVLRFAETSDYIDLSIGDDGLLYALRDTYGKLDVFDPATQTLLKSLALGHTSGSRAVTANSAGDIFMASWNGYVNRFTPDGVQSDTITGLGSLYDIDSDGQGRLLATNRNGDAFVLNQQLDLIGSYFPADFYGSFGTFVAPDPIVIPPPPAAPELSGSSYRQGRWIRTDLSWTTEAESVDIYLNGNLIESSVTETSRSFQFNKQMSQVFQVCNSGSTDCSADFVAN